MTTKSLITLLIILFLAVPSANCFSQKTAEDPAETEFSQTETETTPAKGTKQDKKKKNVVDIDEQFYFSLLVNAISALLIILLIYYPNYKKMDYIFTFIIFNLVIFLLTYVLKNVKLSMGAAFGMFAVFSMLRYRTSGLSVRDMTYIFIFIALGLISATEIEIFQLVVIHAIMLLGIYIMDGNFIIRREFSKNVLYENIEMIKPEHQKALIEDLSARTGLKIHRVSVEKVDFLRDSALIRIYYYE